MTGASMMTTFLFLFLYAVTFFYIEMFKLVFELQGSWIEEISLEIVGGRINEIAFVSTWTRPRKCKRLVVGGNFWRSWIRFVN